MKSRTHGRGGVAGCFCNFERNEASVEKIDGIVQSDRPVRMHQWRIMLIFCGE